MQRKRGFYLNLWLFLGSRSCVMSSPTKSVNDMYHPGEIAIAAVNGFLQHDKLCAGN